MVDFQRYCVKFFDFATLLCFIYLQCSYDSVDTNVKPHIPGLQIHHLTQVSAPEATVHGVAGWQLRKDYNETRLSVSSSSAVWYTFRKAAAYLSSFTIFNFLCDAI